MIKFDNIRTFNFDGAIRGMRNPLESWDKSDTTGDMIGENDLALAQKLVTAGTDDSKFLRQIFVSMDITAPLYWWKEMDTYKVATVANSTSTMHRLASKPITRESFSFDSKNDILVVDNHENKSWHTSMAHITNELIQILENLRQRYLKTKSESYWRALIQLLPESWDQTRTWTANYQVLRNIYFARKNHKLQEWHEFCDVIEQLPYALALICYEGEK